MKENVTFCEKVLKFNADLANESLDLPAGFKIRNPFAGAQREQVEKVTKAFYEKYYHDTHTRRIILGSSPARRGSSVIGVPFEEAQHLQKETGILIDKFYINKASSGFLFDVMERYGGCQKFYADFYMNFVCPLGIVKTNSKGHEVNCNHYENKQLQESLVPFIVRSIQSQIAFGIDTSVCYCIGSGENYKFLSRLNEITNLFKVIIPLEHPRFITQYHSNRREEFMQKYLNALSNL